MHWVERRAGRVQYFMHFALCALALVVRLVARRILVEAVEAVEAAADFLVLAPGASRVTVLKVKQVIGLKMLLMKTCTFVFLAPGQGWLGRVVGYNLAWAAGTGSAAHC